MTPEHLTSFVAAILLAQIFTLAAHESAGSERRWEAASLAQSLLLDASAAKSWLVAGLMQLDAAGALQDPEIRRLEQRATR